MNNRGAVQAWASGITESRTHVGRSNDHLRISEVGAGLLHDDELEFAQEPIRLPAPIAMSSKGTKLAVVHGDGAGQELANSYHSSLKTIDAHIYGLAAAITALDSIETQLTQARSHIEALRSRGEPINVRKAETTLLNLAEQINSAIRRIDLHDVNLMRDSRIELRVVELDTDETRVMGFDLTLISLEKLLAFKLKSDPRDAGELCGLVDALQHTVNSNLHILSSLVLMMFASRDYTDDVSRLVLSDRLEDTRQNGRLAPPRLTTIPLRTGVQGVSGGRPIELASLGHGSVTAVTADPWRRSLMTLLERTQMKAAE